MTARDRPILHWLVFAAAVAAVAILLTVNWDGVGDPADFRNAVTAFVILGVVAEAGFLRIGIGGISSSVAFIPILSAMMLFPAAWAIFVGGVTMLVGEAIIRHKPLIKVVYNVSSEVIAIGAATAAYAAVGGVATFTTFAPSAIGFLAGSVVYFLLNQGTTVLAGCLSSGTPLVQTWRRVVGGSLLFDLVTGPVAILLTWLYVRLDLMGVLLVIVPVFVVRHVYQINLRLEQVNRDLLELMVKAIEARDPYTSGHSVRVSKIAHAMATETGLSAGQADRVATAALLHDVGKIYEEFATLLRKEGKLLPHEEQMMKSHPVRSAELVSTISTMQGEVELAVRHHHERFDGMGYPAGLAGEQIPIGSRIIAIADTVDAMTTDRPYRKALSYEAVTKELRTLAGVQFDPRLVEVFCSGPRVQTVVAAHLERAEIGRPKTVAETFDDLRKAIGQVPNSMTVSGKWNRVPKKAS